MSLLTKLEDNGYVVLANGTIVNGVGRRCTIFYRKGRPYIKAKIKQGDGSIKEERVSAHIAIAEKYLIPPFDDKLHVMFKNGKVTDLRANNLQWADLETCKAESKTSRLRRAGLARIELGEISWQQGIKTYKLNHNVAYSAWKKAQGSDHE